MRIETKTYGTIEIDEHRVIHFVDPVLGFEDAVHYAVLDSNPGSPFKVLQVRDDPERCFLVGDPVALFPDYRVQLTGAQIAGLELDDPADAVVLVILTVHRDPRRLTANLLGPILVNAEKFLAKQVVLAGSGHRVDEPVELAKR